MSLMRFEIAASDGDSHSRRERTMTLLQRLAKLLNPYRPYKHYMRGPGPKCREKEAGGGGRA
jgi:hypothetical protein